VSPAERTPAPRSWSSALDRAGRTRPLIVAHRGDSFHAPENTLEAARRARAAGADAWELDVQLTRDGVPIVLHDASLVRTTNVVRRFAGDPRGARGFLTAEFDVDEIRNLDAGSWFLHPGGGPRTAIDFDTRSRLDEAESAGFASGAVRVPTLAEALRLTAELDWLVNVELKSFPSTRADLLDIVLDVIAATGAAASRVLISSFDHAGVARCARHPRGEALATGVLTATPLDRPERYVRDEIGALAYHPSAEVVGAGSDAYRRAPAPEALRRDDLEALHAHGIPVLVYTVNDAAPDGLAAHLAGAGVDALFSDNPGGLLTLFAGAARCRDSCRMNPPRIA
jgi:glycerophosphoryl diester phosphodiesterase